MRGLMVKFTLAWSVGLIAWLCALFFVGKTWEIILVAVCVPVSLAAHLYWRAQP